MGINVSAFPTTNRAISFNMAGITAYPYGTTAAIILVTTVLNPGDARNVVMVGADANTDDIDVVNIYDAASTPGMWSSTGGVDAKGPTGVAQSHWSIVVVGKDTGTVTPRCHVFDFATGGWNHGAASSTEADSGSTTQAAYTVNGFMNDTFAGIDGDMAAVATWYKRNLSDGEVERLAAGSWNRYSPDVLIEFPSGRVPLGVGPLDHGRQRMKMSQFGASITRGQRPDPPGFRWSLSGRRR